MLIDLRIGLEAVATVALVLWAPAAGAAARPVPGQGGPAGGGDADPAEASGAVAARSGAPRRISGGEV